MKLTHTVGIWAVAVTMTLGTVGCKKNVQKVTPLPESGMAGASKNIGPGDSGFNQNPMGTSSSNISQEGNRDTTGWIEDRQIFAEQTVYFDFDKANIKPSEVPKLQTVASRMQSMPGEALRIDGHCDERGTEEYNRSLGEKRALAVREYLVRLGMDAKNISTKTLGEEEPLDPGHSPGAWAKNRRGQIIKLSAPGAANP